MIVQWNEVSFKVGESVNSYSHWKKNEVYLKSLMTAYIKSWILLLGIYIKGKLIDVSKKVLGRQFIMELFKIEKYVT